MPEAQSEPQPRIERIPFMEWVVIGGASDPNSDEETPVFEFVD